MSIVKSLTCGCDARGCKAFMDLSVSGRNGWRVLQTKFRVVKFTVMDDGDYEVSGGDEMWEEKHWFLCPDHVRARPDALIGPDPMSRCCRLCEGNLIFTDTGLLCSSCGSVP